MDWKDIQNRLNGYESSDLVQRESQLTRGGKVYTANRMRKFWELCHQDRKSSYRELMRQVGFNSGSDYTAVKRWFMVRGWGELPSRIDPVQEYAEDIYGYYKEGLSSIQISGLVPVSQSTVLKVLRESYGVVFEQSKVPTQSDVEEFNRLSEQGYSLRQIGKMTGWTHATITKHRKRKVVPKSEHVTKQKLHREEVIRLYKEGNTQMDIVRATGFSRGTVNRIIQKYKTQ